MRLLRQIVDSAYLKYRDKLFEKTQKDPEVAHENMIIKANILYQLGLSNFVLNQNRDVPFELSNAAGFNKNAEFPAEFMKALGFNRMVVGTVTNDYWKGNEKPRVKRYVETESLVNRMGLPGSGSADVGRRLQSQYGIIPITLNLMSTPGKQGEELLEDLVGTIKNTRDFCDRYELNISCPNTHNNDGSIDARAAYQKNLDNMLKVVTREIKNHELYIKISPDATPEDIDQILDVCADYEITGFTIANTTKVHDERYITSPFVGGASGKAVQGLSMNVQNMMTRKINARAENYKIIAVGGIDSVDQVHQRLNAGASGVQIYTPLIFKGPKLLSDILKANYHIIG